MFFDRSLSVTKYALALLCVCAGKVQAAEPWGAWLVAEKTAEIKVIGCGDALWGFVGWETDPGIDAKNPDPAKRTRPTLGMPVLLGMKPSGPDRWEGAIYNSEDGKTYSGGVSLMGANVLRVRGCVLGFLCGGENWTRVQSPQPATAALLDADLCGRVSGTR